MDADHLVHLLVQDGEPSRSMETMKQSILLQDKGCSLDKAKQKETWAKEAPDGNTYIH